MSRYFDHEQLLAYQLAAEVARWVHHDAKFPAGTASLKDQTARAAWSMTLNLAEGRAVGGSAGRHHYRVALGSAAETCAALVALPDAAARQAELRRVGAMLRRLGG